MNFYRCNKKDLVLYGVTDSHWSTNEYPLEKQVEDAIIGGVTFIQLREKNITTEELIKKALIIKAVCKKYSVPFVIDDNVEAVIKTDADGIHIGQNDLSIREVRRILGNDKIVGVTAKTVVNALDAEKSGASYIGTGAAFETSTKKDTYVLDHGVIRDISKSVSIPVVAIGGIDEVNVSKLKGTGISGVAVVSAVFGKQNIKVAARNLNEIIHRDILNTKE